ncbi:Periplasmic protein involved in Cu(II)/Cu(I) resistance (CzcE-like protein) [Cupriavidus necator]|uniref:Periplasmic protein involved in Cu(II)/Cu(I) resistance (CzcE-like protein) n=2 Tax=Cupriavidus necator TaxID=106590 RepID=A0A1K0JI11_CUPNE|nr:Periplasmic protein involved in Cu(II)/Cu(I) resistance (CzcE-like protein) [Cupriavidus necator]
MTKATLLRALAFSLLGLASACAPMTSTQRAALFGSPAPVPTATRTITLASGMKYVNVNSGETVAFKAGAQTVAWTFLESIHGTSVQMSTILPDIPEAQGIRVYVKRSEFLTGG